MNRVAPLAMVAVALAAASGCSKTQVEPVRAANEAGPAAASKTTDASTPPDHSAERKHFMREHVAKSLAVKDAVVKGMVEPARDAAVWIAEAPAFPDAPDAWLDHLTELRQVMEGARGAKSTGEIAETFARAAVVCGRCHQAAGVTPHLAKSPEPMPDDKDMLVHAWASDQMWKGLILPDPAAWNSGAAAMRDWPLESFARRKGGAAERPRAVALQKLAAKGLAAEDDGARAAIFGEVLATCAGCHTKLAARRDD